MAKVLEGMFCLQLTLCGDPCKGNNIIAHEAKMAQLIYLS